MGLKLIILCFIIAFIAVIYSSALSLSEEHSLSRTKRATCKYLFGWCGDGSKCCKHLFCHKDFKTCWW
uniref:Putative salivary toxin-like peptide n=1 Tax=Nyssomyia neivai TaxID=330878 RepID=A0A1L8DP11_9DIPT